MVLHPPQCACEVLPCFANCLPSLYCLDSSEWAVVFLVGSCETPEQQHIDFMLKRLSRRGRGGLKLPL